MTVDNPDANELIYLDLLEKTGPPEEAVARREEHGYDRDTCLMFGEYMLYAARQAYDRKQRLTDTLVTLANKHGYGPSKEAIRRNFDGALWRFNHELGSVYGLYGFARGRFDDWSNDDFIDYGNDVILRHGLSKPKTDIFDELAKEGRGPSTVILARQYGGIGSYFEKLGFVNPKAWSREDYLNWVSDLTASGLGLALTAKNAGMLSKKRRGPSAKSIIDKYGSLPGLRDDAENRVALYDEDQREAASRRFGVLHLGFMDEEKGGAVEAAFSSSLRMVVIDGEPHELSERGAVLLDLLLRHADSPVYKEDFLEEYKGKNRANGDEAAYRELAGIKYLAPHLMRLEYEGGTVYGLSTLSHDTSLLSQRTLTAADYDSSSGFAKTEKQGRRGIAITISAAGAAVAAASVLVIKSRKKTS